MSDSGVKKASGTVGSKTAEKKKKKTADSRVVKKKSSSSKKRTETHMSVKVNGREIKHPVRKGLIAFGLILCPLAVGMISAAITGSAIGNFDELVKPPLTPPLWLFPVVWTMLYLLMGVAVYYIYRIRPKNKQEGLLKKQEMVLFFTQLLFNFMWAILFFRIEVRFFAFGWLLLMYMMILALIVLTFRNSRVSAWCLVPYLVWCTFAGYLNIMVAVLN